MEYDKYEYYELMLILKYELIQSNSVSEWQRRPIDTNSHE